MPSRITKNCTIRCNVTLHNSIFSKSQALRFVCIPGSEKFSVLQSRPAIILDCVWLWIEVDRLLTQCLLVIKALLNKLVASLSNPLLYNCQSISKTKLHMDMYVRSGHCNSSSTIIISHFNPLLEYQPASPTYPSLMFFTHVVTNLTSVYRQIRTALIDLVYLFLEMYYH